MNICILIFKKKNELVNSLNAEITKKDASTKKLTAQLSKTITTFNVELDGLKTISKDQKEQMKNLSAYFRAHEISDSRFVSILSDLQSAQTEIARLKKLDTEQKGQIKILQEENNSFRARINQLRLSVNRDNVVPVSSNSCFDIKRGKRESDNRSYEVETILDDRIKYRQREYLIHWKGYDSSHDSWVKESKLSCPKILLKYLKSINQ